MIVEPVVAPRLAVSAADELVVEPPAMLPPDPLPPGAPWAQAVPESAKTSEAAANIDVARMFHFPDGVSVEGKPCGPQKVRVLPCAVRVAAQGQHSDTAAIVVRNSVEPIAMQRLMWVR